MQLVPYIFFFAGFKNLSNLRELYLRKNNIGGILPSFLFPLPHIEVLDLSFNMLQGAIPISSSSNLSLSLRSLDLSHNDLSGRFSFIWLNNLSNLVEIDLSENVNLGVNVNVPGWVPRFQLKHLSLDNCDLDKGIIANPEFLATQHHLEYPSLGSNNLSGDMPNWLFAKGSTPIELYLGNNSHWISRLNMAPSCLSNNLGYIQEPYCRSAADQHQLSVSRSLLYRCFEQQLLRRNTHVIVPYQSNRLYSIAPYQSNRFYRAVQQQVFRRNASLFVHRPSESIDLESLKQPS
jgi:hypothetical protein